MKTSFLSITFFAAATACTRNPATHNEGILIKGISWATRNIDAAGTFAEKLEDAGMLYLWNRKKAWNATSKAVEGWDASILESSEWEKANDPFSECWRVPTFAEIRSLLNTGKVTNEWATLNGINGKLFIDKENGNSIFMPMVGCHRISNGTLLHVGVECFYWSNTRDKNYTRNAYNFGFNEDSVVWVSVGGNFGR
jgi:hypothetical protein